jgi:CHAT domain-containing protein
MFADPVFEKTDVRVNSTDFHKTSRSYGPQVKLAGATTPDEESAHIRFLRLPFTRQEASSVIPFVSPDQRLIALDFAASRATATSADLAQYRVIHFATHSLLDQKHPELSGIALSFVDERGRAQDGFLPLQDIYDLKLNADLVVLSACQSGLGKEVKGEGLIGLTRGFMYAGSPRVVTTLWKVDDKATAELMKHFYQGLLGERRLSPAAALREAQIALWRRKRWHDPKYWAAFVLQGEWK